MHRTIEGTSSDKKKEEGAFVVWLSNQVSPDNEFFPLKVEQMSWVERRFKMRARADWTSVVTS